MNSFSHFCLNLLVIICLAVPALAADSLLIREVGFTPLDANNEWVSFQLNGPYTPKPFTIKGERPRVVFDFFNVGITRAVASMNDVNGKLVRRIRVGLHGGTDPKARIVLDLQPGRDVAFEFRQDKQTNLLSVRLYDAQVKTEPAQVPEYSEETAPAASAPRSESAPRQAGERVEPVPEEQRDAQSARAGEAAADPQPEPAEPSPAGVVPQSGQTADTAQPFLESIRFDAASNKGEMVLFKLNDFYPPVVFGIEEGLPRVVCDFKNTVAGPDVSSEINANGRYVKTVRIGKHNDPDKVRVVLDLEPNHNYDLQQVFFREDNLFVIIVNTTKNLPAVQ